TQVGFQQEISAIRRELAKLKGSTVPTTSFQPPVEPRKTINPITGSTELTVPSPQPTYVPPRTAEVPPPVFEMNADAPNEGSPSEPESAFSKYVSDYKDSARADLEKFIGENLISKIGIIVLVLGVGIGAKYAIDNGWISPLLRIAFGYVMG